MLIGSTSVVPSACDLVLLTLVKRFLGEGGLGHVGQVIGEYAIKGQGVSQGQTNFSGGV